MKQTLTVVQIIISLILSVLILLQAKGVGLGHTMGSQAYHSKRGMEVIIFRFTIIIAVTFVVLSTIVQLFL